MSMPSVVGGAVDLSSVPKISGTPKSAEANITPPDLTWRTLLNISSGSGNIGEVCIEDYSSVNFSYKFRVTIDAGTPIGNVNNYYTIGGGVAAGAPKRQTMNFNYLRFNSSLLVEVNVSNTNRCMVLYTED